MIREWVQFEQIVALASDAILVLDHQGVIRYANAAAERLFDRPIEALLEQVFGFVVIPDEPIEIEIEIPRAVGRITSADMRCVDMAMDGQQMSVVYLRDVTERKQAEQETLRRETFYASILEDLPELICRWLPDGTINYVNDNFCRYFGRTKEDLIGGRFLPQSPEKNRERIDRELADHLRRLAESPDKENAFFVTEARAFRADRVLRRQRWLNRGLFDSAGQITEIQSTGQDITEASEAARKLRESERIVEAASSLARIGGWEADLRNGQLTWSDEVCRLHEEPSGTSPRIEEGISYYAPEWRERITRTFGAWARDGVGFDEALELITAGGHRRWVRVIGAAVRDKAGRITHVQGAIQDITEQRKTEEQLRLSAAVFDNTSEGVLITDTTPKIIAINRAFTEINGYAAEDVLGRSPGLLNSGRHEPGFYAALWSELLAQGHWRGEIWNRRKDGEIYPQWVNINAVRSESGLTTEWH